MCEQFRKCVKCGVLSTNEPSLSFHRFPRIGKERPDTLLRSRIWAEFSYTNDNYNDPKFLKKLYTSHKMLCSRHFEADSFVSENKLNKFSVPIGMENILQKAINEARSSYQVSFKMVPSHVQQPEKYAEEYTPFSVATNISQQTGGLELLSTSDMSKNNSILKQVPESGKHFSVPTNISTQTEVLELLSSSDMSENIAIPKQVPEDVETDMENYIKYKIVGGRIKLKNGAFPHKFKCQQEKKDKSARSAVHKRKKIYAEILNLNNQKLQEHTSKEQLLKICRKRLQKICVLKHKWKNLKQINNLVHNDDVRKLFEYKISDDLVLLLQSQTKYYRKKPRRRHYTLKEQVLALPLYKRSPAIYRLLRRFFSLPCQNSLKKLVKKVPLDPGINRQIFAGLADMVQINENVCTLMFNEMNIKKSEDVKIKALVFMLSGVVKNWKQPIAYYMLANYTTVDILVLLIKEVLEECFNVGLNIVATVCKLSPVNIKALEMLGSTKEKPFFNYKQYEIVTILDPPHLLKCFRDLFMEHDVLYSTDLLNKAIPILATAKWSHIQTFYEKEKMNSKFVFAPALTEIHIYPNKKQKMRVKHAAQIFSHSVAAGIMAKSSHELPAEAVTTAHFLNRMDELFDALNADSKDLRRGKKYSLYLTNKSPHLENLRNMKILISELRFLGLDTNPSCQEGWIRTINAVEKLWHNLYRLRIRSLATRRLNLDVLENCFACIRYNCGSNSNPTVSQFVAGIKTAVITNLKYCGRHKNCEDDTLVIANNLQAFLVSGDIEKTSNILDSCQYNP